MNKFANKVIVATEEKWNENEGSHCIAWEWTGETLIKHVYANGRDGLHPDDVSFNATDEQVYKAARFAEEKMMDHRVRSSGLTDLTGATVVLKRSRLAENGVELVVKGYEDKRYDSRLMAYVPAKIKVAGRRGVDVWVVCTCATVIRGKTPWWGK